MSSDPVEIFRQEAQDLLEEIERGLLDLERRPGDRDLVNGVFRSLHTLKGSGRVVGARRIGDFAWSVENLLNRVIDGTLERSSAMLATLREAIGILPSLVGELSSDSPDVPGVEELSARLEAHATGQVAAAAKAEAALAAPPPEPVAAAAPAEKAAPVEESAEAKTGRRRKSS